MSIKYLNKDLFPSWRVATVTKFEKVLIISKKTELEFYEDKFGANVDAFMQRNNIDVASLEENHTYHYDSLNNIKSLFKQNGIKPGIIRKQSIGRRDFDEQWDLVVSVGGDGTFMDVARYIMDDTLLFGIKSSPRSIGGHYNTNFSNAEEHIKRLLTGDYFVEKRARVEGIIENGHVIKDLAVNEIAIGDKYMTGYSKLEVYLNDEKFPNGSSGLIASTYCGKTGWYDKVPLLERDPAVIKKAQDCLAEIGMGDRIINHPAAEFNPREENVVRYKTMMGGDNGQNYGYDYGIIRPGDEIKVVSKILMDGWAAFDGDKPTKPRPRCYDLFFGSVVSIRASDKPLHVVAFDE